MMTRKKKRKENLSYHFHIPYFIFMPYFAGFHSYSFTQERAMQLQSMKCKYVLLYVNDFQHCNYEQANCIASKSSMCRVHLRLECSGDILLSVATHAT